MMCDAHQDMMAQMATTEAIKDRREAEAREFLHQYLNPEGDPEKCPACRRPSITILPDSRTVHLVVAAMEYAKRSVRAERDQAEPLPGTYARFSMLEWDMMEVAA